MKSSPKTYTKNQALKLVANTTYLIGQKLEDVPITHIIIVPNYQDIGDLVNAYASSKVSPKDIAELYGNGANLFVMAAHLGSLDTGIAPSEYIENILSSERIESLIKNVT